MLDNEALDLPSRNVPRNRMIMLRYLEGQSVEAIAQIYGLQTGTIRGILASPLVKQEMARIQDTVAARVVGLADEALDKVRDTMRGENVSELQYKAANSILDRNPDLRPKTDARDLVEGLGEGMIRAISKQLREAESGNGNRNDTEGRGTSSLQPPTGPEEGFGRSVGVLDRSEPSGGDSESDR